MVINTVNFLKFIPLFPSVLKYNVGYQVGIHKMLDRIANMGSLIRVCAACLGLLGRQLVFKILENELYNILL